MSFSKVVQDFLKLNTKGDWKKYTLYTRIHEDPDRVLDSFPFRDSYGDEFKVTNEDSVFTTGLLLTHEFCETHQNIEEGDEVCNCLCFRITSFTIENRHHKVNFDAIIENDKILYGRVNLFDCVIRIDEDYLKEHLKYYIDNPVKWDKEE